ncbi:hypothetical protein A5714_11235 [Mycobacterium sp. E2462]|uniref:YbjN domain-containing protein n=1 Tax=Mycobacterium sp. E2462 TaxID=1834133 RepID=UPI000800D905|nr:YbjN domain-containing protein [Mycobacterium sp. E2462]OBI16359.1 hypothetical protein A5714_11235 [Mycobacterium sp. E2462]
MQIEPLSTELIERYLRSHPLRFFRSDDGEEFLLTSPHSRGKLSITLRINGLRRDILEVSISPAAHYPAAERPRLLELVNEWNRDTHWPKAFVRETPHPGHVSVVGENAYLLTHGIHPQALGDLVRSTVEHGADLFDKIERSLRQPSADVLERWLDRTN